MAKKKPYEPDFFYSVEDTVMRKNDLNEEEALITGLNYREMQTIVKEERIGNHQLLYFKSAPDHWHNAYEFLPFGKTLEECKAFEASRDQRLAEIKRNKTKKKGKGKTNPKVITFKMKL